MQPGCSFWTTAVKLLFFILFPFQHVIEILQVSNMSNNWPWELSWTFMDLWSLNSLELSNIIFTTALWCVLVQLCVRIEFRDCPGCIQLWHCIWPQRTGFKVQYPYRSKVLKVHGSVLSLVGQGNLQAVKNIISAVWALLGFRNPCLPGLWFWLSRHFVVVENCFFFDIIGSLVLSPCAVLRLGFSIHFIG